MGLFNGLQPFQHLLAGLCHLGGGSTHQITGHIVLQLGALRLLLLVQLLLAGILLLPLASVGGVVALVFPQGTVLQLPYFVAELIKKVAVVRNYQQRSLVAGQVILQPAQCGKVKMVGRLI